MPSRELESKDIVLSNAVRIRYYHRAGPGPKLILLHPSTAYGRVWEWTIEHLDARFDVYAPDQRGHGDSDRPDGDYSAQEYAEDLRLFMDQLGIERATLAGHSLGGRVAQCFGGMFPERAEALFLVGGPHYSNFFQTREQAQRVLESAERMHSSLTEVKSREDALEVVRGVTSLESQAALDHWIEYNTRTSDSGAICFKYDSLRVAQGLTHMADDLKPYAARVTCPVVIVRSAESETLSRAQANEMAKFWENAGIAELEGGYFLEMDNPVGLANLLNSRTFGP